MGGLPVVKEGQLDKGFLSEVKEWPGGEKIENCIQCGTCSGSCPSSHKMDYTPRKLITMIRAGMKEKVLKSKAIWMCASCYSCTVRCPRGIAITDLMYSLKNMSIRGGYHEPKLTGPVFYKEFNSMVEKEGRINETKLMTAYLLKTNPFKMFGMAPLGMKLMLKKRLSFKVDSIANKEEFGKMLARLREARDNEV